jgi:hypothetical protein
MVGGDASMPAATAAMASRATIRRIIVLFRPKPLHSDTESWLSFG